MNKIILFILGLLFSFNGISQTVNTDSSQIVNNDKKSLVRIDFKNATKSKGDSAYLKNDYSAAVEIYELLLKKGESADIYYNLGNSYYKAGEIAKAVLNYERALLLNPGDGDIRANLDIARSKTIDKEEPIAEIFFITWIKSLINCMNVNAWGIFGIVAFVLFIVASSFYVFSKESFIRKIGFFSGILFLIITISANIFAHSQKERLLNRNFAIIIDPSVMVRSTPSESGTTLFVLHEGKKVKIKDSSMKGWKEIKLEDGKVGWIPSGVIEVI